MKKQRPPKAAMRPTPGYGLDEGGTMAVPIRPATKPPKPKRKGTKG